MPADAVETVARALQSIYPTYTMVRERGTDTAGTVTARRVNDTWDEETPQRRAELQRDASAAIAALGLAGLTITPVMPTEVMWAGLARDLVMWWGFQTPSGIALYEHLKAKGAIIPGWLREEIPETTHVPPKGTVAACIYRAMINAGAGNG